MPTPQGEHIVEQAQQHSREAHDNRIDTECPTCLDFALAIMESEGARPEDVSVFATEPSSRILATAALKHRDSKTRKDVWTE